MTMDSYHYCLAALVLFGALFAESEQFGFSTETLPYYGVTEPIDGELDPQQQHSDFQDTDEMAEYPRINPETLLIRDLFKNYDDVARPVLNMSKSVEVKFGYRLLSIQLNEVDQLLTSFVWLPHHWRDERLTWRPQDFGLIETLIIPNKMLWLPDTFLYQSSDDTGYVTSFDRVPLTYTGEMEWWPSATLLSPCIIDVTFFPFDYQQCSLTLGPWGYHSEQVNYTLMDDHANLDRYTVSGAWELMETHISRDVQFYPDLNMSYTLIDVTIKLKRKALYYWLNVIIPCLLLNSLGIGLFILPADSGEKVSFGLGILLTVFVFAILVNENIPKTSDYTPVMGIYLVVIMGMISLSLFLAIIIENLHHRRPKLKPVPKWLKSLLFGKLTKFLGIKLPKGITPKKRKRNKMMKRLRQAHEELERAAAEELSRMNIPTAEENGNVENGGIQETTMSNGVNGGAVPSHSTPSPTPEPPQTEEERLREAYKNMPFDEKDNDEWILIALVMDSLLCWVFLVLLIMTSSMVLVIVPTMQSLRYK